MAARKAKMSFAGQTFDFELPEVVSEGGTDQTESVLSSYFPELKLKFGTPTGKTSRGGRLGRQTLPVTPEVTFKKAGDGANINVSATAPTTISQTLPLSLIHI